MAELWDAYDSDLCPIEGLVLERGAPIPDGVYHFVCEILVKHTDGDYLLMQRDATKHLGGLWEASAGGAALQGETPLQSAVRELREETGIVADEMIELGRILHHRHHTIYVDFLALTAQDKNAVTLQPGETQAFRWVTPGALVQMSRQELVTERIQLFVDELKER